MALRDLSSNKVRGVFTADYHLRALADFLANLDIGKQGRGYLLGRGGEFLAAPERGALTPDALLSTAIQKSETALPGGIHNLPVDEPKSYSFKHDGQAYVAAVHAFQPALGFPIVTVVLIPEDDITGPVKAAALQTAEVTGSVAVLAIVLSIAIGVFQKRRLVKTLAQRKRQLENVPEETSL